MAMHYIFNGVPIPLAMDYKGKSFSDGCCWYKVFKDEDSFFREKMMLEAVARAHCPGVVQMYEAGILTEVRDDGHTIERPAIKEEYVEGATFEDYTGNHHNEEDGICFFIRLAEILSGLEHAHIIHNDLKPINIIVRDGEPVLIDFGISKKEEEEVLGIHTFFSEGFSAKEKANKSVTYRSDICSFGYLIQYYMDRNPDGGASARKRNYSEEFRSILRKCIDDDPEKRFPSFNDLTKALKDLAETRLQAEERKQARKSRARREFIGPEKLFSDHLTLITVLLYLISGLFIGLGIYMRL